MNGRFYPLKFSPIYKDYMWGGHELEKFGKSSGTRIAESWEISGLPGNESVVLNGEFAGMTLPALLDEFPDYILGRTTTKEQGVKFPLLIKFIDANLDLSIQVHPGDEFAGKYENGRTGKSEAWHIISAKPGARIIAGLKQGITRDAFIDAIDKKKVEECLDYIEVAPGDTIYIPAGLVHSIGKGLISGDPAKFGPDIQNL